MGGYITQKHDVVVVLRGCKCMTKPSDGVRIVGSDQWVRVRGPHFGTNLPHKRFVDHVLADHPVRREAPLRKRSR